MSRFLIDEIARPCRTPAPEAPLLVECDGCGETVDFAECVQTTVRLCETCTDKAVEKGWLVEVPCNA